MLNFTYASDDQLRSALSLLLTSGRFTRRTFLKASLRTLALEICEHDPVISVSVRTHFIQPHPASNNDDYFRAMAVTKVQNQLKPILKDYKKTLA